MAIRNSLFLDKKATPGGAARDIESIWEERYSMVQSSGGDELYDMFKSQIAAMQKC